MLWQYDDKQPIWTARRVSMSCSKHAFFVGFFVCFTWFSLLTRLFNCDKLQGTEAFEWRFFTSCCFLMASFPFSKSDDIKKSQSMIKWYPCRSAYNKSVLKKLLNVLLFNEIRILLEFTAYFLKCMQYIQYVWNCEPIMKNKRGWIMWKNIQRSSACAYNSY